MARFELTVRVDGTEMACWQTQAVISRRRLTHTSFSAAKVAAQEISLCHDVKSVGMSRTSVTNLGSYVKGKMTSAMAVLTTTQAEDNEGGP